MAQKRFSLSTMLSFSLMFTIFQCQITGVTLGSALKNVDDQAFKFMQNFGYLELAMNNSDSVVSGASSLTPAELTHHQDGLKRIIREIQHYGGLEENGELDESTLKLMSSQRCGCPDVLPRSQRSKRYVLAAGNWNRNNITYYLDLWNTKFNRKTIRRELDKAFKLWSNYGHIQFEEMRDKRADIVISFQTGKHEDWNEFDGPGGILAHAFFPGETPSIAGDIHFDEDEIWSFDSSKGDADGPDFFTTAVHELGHSLGLAHSPEQDSIMNPYYKFQNTGYLGSDDILGIYERFIAKGHPAPTTHSYTVNPSTKQTTPTTINPESSSRPPTNLPQTSSRPSTTEKTQSSTFKYHHKPQRFHHECSKEHPYHCPHHRWEEHHQHRRNTSDTRDETSNETEPDICKEGLIDAISAYRGELLVFRNQWLWRLRELGETSAPFKVQRLFSQLPQDLKKIDAAFQNDISSTLVLFSGSNFWEFYGSSLKRSGILQDFGLPSWVTRIDAASEWKVKDKASVLLFGGSKIWLLDPTSSRVRPMEDLPTALLDQLKLLPETPTAAFVWNSDVHSLVRDKYYWNLMEDEPHLEQPDETIAQYVFKCELAGR
uniref:Matrix metalloproteinase-24 n=1 Tax=Cacopsylla melanoneura TaxID=428564 RepID=A0A8D9DVM3_9HEMI